MNLNNFIADAAKKYALSQRVGGLGKAGSTEVRNVIALPIAPNLPVGRVRFKVASEISRDRSTKPIWDQFDVVFMMWKLEERDSLVSVSIERYKDAPRAGRKTPPSSDYFEEPEGEESWDDDLVISSSVADYFSKIFQERWLGLSEQFGAFR